MKKEILSLLVMLCMATSVNAQSWKMVITKADGSQQELYTADIKDIIHYGLDLQPYGFLFFGYNIGIRMSMTSLGNVRASTIITIMQEVVFSNLTVVLLPMIFGIKGVWYSFMAGNALTFILSLLVVYLNRDNYGYGKSRIALLID